MSKSKNRMISTFLYIIALASLVALFALGLFHVPQHKEFFAHFCIELPIISQLALTFSDFLSSFYYVIFPLAIIITSLAFFINSEPARSSFLFFLIILYVIGCLILYIGPKLAIDQIGSRVIIDYYWHDEPKEIYEKVLKEAQNNAQKFIKFKNQTISLSLIVHAIGESGQKKWIADLEQGLDLQLKYDNSDNYQDEIVLSYIFALYRLDGNARKDKLEEYLASVESSDLIRNLAGIILKKTFTTQDKNRLLEFPSYNDENEIDNNEVVKISSWEIWRAIRKLNKKN